MGKLEDISLWVKYKTPVWNADTEQTSSAHTTMRTFRGMHNLGEVSYLSCPITSGKELYNILLEQNLSPEERMFLTGSAASTVKAMKFPKFREWIGETISKNYLIGQQKLEQLKSELDIPIIFPADLFPRGQRWTQQDFQALWTTLIGEKISQVNPCDGWEYSTGAVEEFTHAYQLRLGIPKGEVGPDHSPFYNTKEDYEKEKERMRNIQVYDSSKKIISLNDGVEKIDKALEWITENSFEPDRLIYAREVLEKTGDLIESGFYQE